ncbi:MAG: class I SAM-dependent methyltransferase [Stigonema ocellatum SAG 48.90 = DSM 106950]|nr:class I SAM-dependent methyltransferase [Stigonema ocellatum SAG 48.90 = DSM 106950]
MINTTIISTTKEMYSSVEFNFWAYKEKLLLGEKFLIETYLDENLKTVEAGTGGGRIALSMQQMGFKNLYAFDYVPDFIEIAKNKNNDKNIYFTVNDATSLNYKDCEFNQLLYLQQVISTIEDAAGRYNAFKEAYRILIKGGKAIFSLLNFDSRVTSPFYAPYLVYLRLFRKIGNVNRSIQYLPQLKYAGETNLESLLDRPPYFYWYRLEEAYQIIQEANFKIVALGTDFQISQGKMHTSLETLKQAPNKGNLYFVCTK